MVRVAKTRADKNAWDYDLIPKVIWQRAEAGYCEATGVKFDFSPTRHHARLPCAPSLDRIDSLKGYTMTNVQVVCLGYNLMKSNFPDGAIEDFINQMVAVKLKEAMALAMAELSIVEPVVMVPGGGAESPLSS